MKKQHKSTKQRKSIKHKTETQKLPKRTPSLDEIDELLPMMPKTINNIIHGYVGNPFIITLNIKSHQSHHTTPNLIPTLSAMNHVSIDWGDDNYDHNYGFTYIKHEYTQPGIYTVHIYGEITRISFKNVGYLVQISQWGNLRLLSGRKCFSGCENLTITAHDQPNLSDARDLSCMFRNCVKLGNIDMSKWDVSKITNMSDMFQGCKIFNSDLSNWNVSNVNNMSCMFGGCIDFKSDLSSWNVCNVNNMSCMFCGCINFKSDLSSWNVCNVINMSCMFFECKLFNSDLSLWDVRNVVNMSCMFWNCISFNSNLNNWKIQNIADVFN
jgi:surface protein